MPTSKVLIEGIVARDIYGSWDDCSPGLYIDSEHESTILAAIDQYSGCRVRITIEEIPEPDGYTEIDDDNV